MGELNARFGGAGSFPDLTVAADAVVDVVGPTRWEKGAGGIRRSTWNVKNPQRHNTHKLGKEIEVGPINWTDPRL